jgi:hypothetical protein
MVTDWSNDNGISPRQALFRVGSTALAGVGIGVSYTVTGWGLPCPFRALTGWLCPFCGGTHLAASLLHGDIVGAWAANPLAVVVGVLVGIRTVGWIVELVRNPHAPSRRWLPASWSLNWFGAFVVISVLYVLARNLLPIG